MTDETKKQTSIQVNVRMPPTWLRDFRELAQKISQHMRWKVTAQDAMRMALEEGFSAVGRRYGIR